MSADFDEQVQRQVERLRRSPLAVIEREVAQKRTAWQRAHGPGPDPHATPRQAFELLFSAYMGLDLADLPIVSESESEISWWSRNPCPTLEACRALGLDTRRVCRGAYERSTQAFLSQIDPQLRFARSYTEIRPHAGHCLESIVKVNFEGLMRQAIGEAQASGERCGAAAVLGKQGIAAAQGAPCGHCTGDLQAHAPARALKAAAQALGNDDLTGVVLVSTVEPCAGCLALAEEARASAVVYGAAQTGPEAREKLPAGMVERIGGVLETECLELIGRFNESFRRA